MSLKKWTDEELASARDQIEGWRTKHDQSIWNGRKGNIVGLLGVFGISTGVVFLTFDGIDVTGFIPILPGTAVCFTWWKIKQQYKKNSGFLDEVKEEITRRAKKLEKVEKIEKTEKVEKKAGSDPVA